MKNFFVNHRRGIAIGGLVVGGSVLAVRYAQRKLHQYQLDQAKVFLEKTRRTQHFEATERTCNQVITSLAPTLCDEILSILNTDEILEQLRKNPENKTELWNELKMLSFARLTTLVYASSMLVIGLRVQVNLVGGYVYKDNVPNSRGSTSPATQDQVLPSDFMQTYLSEIQYFLKEGVEKLAKSILEVTRKILQDYKLKKQLTLTDMEQIFWAIQMSVNATTNDPNAHIPEYMFNKQADLSHNPTIKQLVLETMDVLDSEEVAVIAANNVSRGFSIVVDHLAEYLTETVNELNKAGGAGPSGDQAVTNPNTIQMALAKIIPIVNGLTAKPFNMTVTPPNLATALVTLFMLNDKVKMLGVNVYELFST